MIEPVPTRRIAVYMRVSSDDQRERETINTQRDAIERFLERDPHATVVTRLEDDGVSGTIPLEDRPGGGRLISMAKAGAFNELLVYKVDRLGRDAIDVMAVRRRLETLGIRLVTVVEGELDQLAYDVQAVVGDYYRREFLRNSTNGMNRAAREGRYTGGIVPFGYRVDGRKQHARHVPDDALIAGERSAADWVRWMYERLAIDQWSCRRVATALNELGVPTAYARAGRGVRGRQTRGEWRAGRVRNLVTNPVYRGELIYGRRTTKAGRERITAIIPGAIVSNEVWRAAQATLAANRVIPKNTRRVYLLRGVIRCSVCGLTYCGSRGRDDVAWYRCNGQLAERGSHRGRCPGRSVRSDAIEPAVWADIERFLRNPGELLQELAAERDAEDPGAAAEAEAATLRRRLEELAGERARAISLVVSGTLPEDDLKPEFARIAEEQRAVEARLAAQEPPQAPTTGEMAPDIEAALQAGVDSLNEAQRGEIARLLVASITIHGDNADRRSPIRAVVEYRFPAVVETRTGTGSWPPRAGIARGTS